MGDQPPFSIITDDVSLGRDVKIYGFVNLYGCSIGDETMIGPFVEIQRGVAIGSRCKIQSHTTICTGVVIEDDVFVGHNVTFTNDRHPRAVNQEGLPAEDSDWTLEKTLVRRGASLGSGVVVLPGLEIGTGAMVGSGAVVTRDVPSGAVVAGNPAKQL